LSSNMSTTLTLVTNNASAMWRWCSSWCNGGGCCTCSRTSFFLLNCRWRRSRNRCLCSTNRWSRPC
jgi:hypothetical protein